MASSTATTETTMTGINIDDQVYDPLNISTIDVSFTKENGGIKPPCSHEELSPPVDGEDRSKPIVQPIQAKHQMLPFVCIQAPSKLLMSQGSATKAKTIPQIQLSSFSSKTSLAQNITLPTSINQNVILTKPQPLLLQKSSVPFVPVSVAPTTLSKNSVTYLLKPLSKHHEQNLLSTSFASISSLNKVKTDISSSNHKFMLTPMPKVTTNRLPVTATTNSVQPKIALMPIHESKKMFNFKISDGQLQSDNNGSIKILCGENVKLPDDVNTPKDEVVNVEIKEDKANCADASDTSDKQKTPKMVTDVPSKFPKHGVSILKRSFNLLEHKVDKQKTILSSSITVSNSIPTVSDSTVKEVKMEKDVKVQRPERRRKSQFFCRMDYDDIKNNFMDDYEPSKVKIPKLEQIVVQEAAPENIPLSADHDQHKTSKEKNVSDINMNDKYDISKMLTWDNGIGTLPGSELQFRVNEFGMLEYVTKDEMKKDKRTEKMKETKNNAVDEVQCINCGCFGMLSDFINPKYCSGDCMSTNEKHLREKEMKIKKKKRKGYLKKSYSLTERIEKESTPSDGETSNETSQDKYIYPWACSKKGFSWSKYLDHLKVKAAPLKLFKDPFPYTKNGFRTGMKLEGIDPQHPSYFCVLTVVEVIGYRIRLHFDGYSENYDFWVNADSMDIFPAGWCEKHSHILQPPPGHTMKDFNWNIYMKQTKTTAAPKHLFSNRSGNVSA